MNIFELLFGKDSVLFKDLIIGTPQSNIFGEILCIVNIVLMTFFAILYFHQFFWMVVSCFKSKKYKETKNLHTYGYLIAARNESNVIEQIINSIQSQDYPKDKMKIFVIADNCSDNTAQLAKKMGVKVYERFNQTLKGKSYALDYLLNKIHEDKLDSDIDAYFIFDADNLLDSNFTSQMNKAYDNGCKVVTSYRNATNVGKNMWTFGSSYSFLRECDLLHKARSVFNKSVYISGTGFLIDKSIILARGGWKQHSMIEDIEFTITYILEKQKVYYCHDAIFYDQQPEKLKDSWNQRMRWVKGLYQCFYGYAGKLLKQLFCFKKPKDDKIDTYEILLFTLPLPLITILWLGLFNVIMALNMAFGGCNITYFLQTSLSTLVDFILTAYAYCLAMCLLISIKNWKRIKCSPIRKILLPFTFFFFMITYIPILFIAPFKKVQWVPITHTTSQIK